MKSWSVSEIRFNCQARGTSGKFFKILVKIFCVFIAEDDFHFETLRPVRLRAGCLMTGVAVKVAKFLGDVISQPGPVL